MKSKEVFVSKLDGSSRLSLSAGIFKRASRSCDSDSSSDVPQEESSESSLDKVACPQPFLQR